MYELLDARAAMPDEIRRQTCRKKFSPGESILLKGGEIKRIVRKLKKGDNLFELSNELDQYKGFVVSDINAISDTLSFTNGVELNVGDASGDVNEAALRRIHTRADFGERQDPRGALEFIRRGLSALCHFS